MPEESPIDKSEVIETPETGELDLDKLAMDIFKLRDTTFARFGMTPEDPVNVDEVMELQQILATVGPQVVKKLAETGKRDEPNITPEDLKHYIKQFAWHDMFHMIANYHATGGAEGGRLESLFLETVDEIDQIRSPQIMKEEVEALLWDTILTRENNLMTALTSPEEMQKFIDSFVDRFIPKYRIEGKVEKGRENHAKIAEMLIQYQQEIAEAGTSPEKAFKAYCNVVLSIIREVNRSQIAELEMVYGPNELETLARMVEQNIRDIEIEFGISEHEETDEVSPFRERFMHVWEQYKTDKSALLKEFLVMARGLK